MPRVKYSESCADISASGAIRGDIAYGPCDRVLIRRACCAWGDLGLVLRSLVRSRRAIKWMLDADRRRSTSDVEGVRPKKAWTSVLYHLIFITGLLGLGSHIRLRL